MSLLHFPLHAYPSHAHVVGLKVKPLAHGARHSPVMGQKFAAVAEQQGAPVPSHVQVVVRQLRVTLRLQSRYSRLLARGPQAARISSAQTVGLHGRVAVATGTMVVTARTVAPNAPINFTLAIVTSLSLR